MIAEWLISIIILVISFVFFALTFTFSDIPCDPGGMALFPRAVSVIAGVAALLLMVRLLKSRSSDTRGPLESIGKFFGSWKKGSNDEASVTGRRMTYIFLASIAYPWFIVKAGFLPATLAYVFVLMKLFRSKTLISIILSSIVASTLYFFFIKVLQAYVPPGIWLENIFD